MRRSTTASHLVILPALNPVDHRIGDGEHDDLDHGLPDETDDDVVEEGTHRVDADDRRCDGAEDDGIAKLPHHSGADQACPQGLFARAGLDFDERPRVEELAHQVTSKGRCDDLGDKPDDGGEGLLAVIEGGRGKCDADIEGNHGEEHAAEA